MSTTFGHREHEIKQVTLVFGSKKDSIVCEKSGREARSLGAAVKGPVAKGVQERETPDLDNLLLALDIVRRYNLPECSVGGFHRWEAAKQLVPGITIA